MALIKCPECEKEISDKANVCPSCGCPIHGETKAEEQKGPAGEKQKKTVLLVAVVVAIVIIAVMGVVIGKKTKTQPGEDSVESTEDIEKQTYRDATDLLLEAKYDEAKELFDTIPDYLDVPTILEQIPWETKTFVCLDELKDRLKDPDSLNVYDVYFFGTEPREDAKLDKDDIESFQKIFGADAPGSVCLIHYGATNTMGGMTDSAAFFVYDVESKNFHFWGATKTLDEDEATGDEADIVFMYNIMKDNFKTVGNIDTKRINSILKSGVYINVHIIE